MSDVLLAPTEYDFQFSSEHLPHLGLTRHFRGPLWQPFDSSGWGYFDLAHFLAGVSAACFFLNFELWRHLIMRIRDMSLTAATTGGDRRCLAQTRTAKASLPTFLWFGRTTNDEIFHQFRWVQSLFLSRSRLFGNKLSSTELRQTDGCGPQSALLTKCGTMPNQENADRKLKYSLLCSHAKWTRWLFACQLLSILFRKLHLWECNENKQKQWIDDKYWPFRFYSLTLNFVKCKWKINHCFAIEWPIEYRGARPGENNVQVVDDEGSE